VRLSMEGRGRWMHNKFIERVWRSLRHEDVYLKGYMPRAARRKPGGAYFGFCNAQCLHPALGSRAPMAVWRQGAAPDQEPQQTEPLAA
jgi:putative transposase